MNIYSFKLLGQDYKVESDKSFDFLQSIFSLFEQKVLEMRERFPQLDINDLMLFSCLNIIEETIEKKELERKILQERINLLIEKLGAAGHL